MCVWFIPLLFVCFYVCVYLQIQGPLRECCSILPGASVLLYYCAPLVCVPDVIGLLAVWWHNKPKTKKQSHCAPCAFTGMHLQKTPQSRCPAQPFPSIPGSMFYIIYLTRDSTAQRVCSPGAGFNPPKKLSPCDLPVSCCLTTSVVQLRNSKWLVAPLRVYVCICMDSVGPAWSSLAQNLYGSERHESGICTSPSPGPWRVPWQYGVDCGVWLTSTQTYIDFVVPFMV